MIAPGSRPPNVKLTLPALTEAASPYWRPIKYSLFPPLGLATLAAYLSPDDRAVVVDQHVEPLTVDDEQELVVIQVYITNAQRAYSIADHYRSKGRSFIWEVCMLPHRPACSAVGGWASDFRTRPRTGGIPAVDTRDGECCREKVRSAGWQEPAAGRGLGEDQGRSVATGPGADRRAGRGRPDQGELGKSPLGHISTCRLAARAETDREHRDVVRLRCAGGERQDLARYVPDQLLAGERRAGT